MSVETPVPLQVFPAVDAKPDAEELELGIKVADDDGPSYTPEEERRVRIKQDIFMLPILCFMNICAFLDKANIGNANTAGMSKDLGFSTSQYNALLTIFYVVYTAFQWEMVLLRYINPRYFLTGVVFLWGLASTLQGITVNYGGMVACRVVVAALESGGGPAIAFYFTMLYPRKEFGLRWAIFQASSCIANAFAGAAAYGLVQANTSIAPWRLVYLVESTPTFLAAVLIFFMVPGGPDQCWFLNDREKQIALERVQRSQSKEAATGYNMKHVKAAFMEPWTYWIALIHFFGGAAFNSLSVFLTAIIRDMGYTSVNAQGLSAPPYIVAYIFACTVAYLSDRWSVRGWFIAGAELVGGIGYLVISYAESTGVRYFATYITVIGVYVGQPLMFSWCATNADSHSKRAASLVLFLVTGQLGSILGSNIYNDPPRYHKGNSVCAGGLFAVVALCISGTFYLKMRNRAKDKMYGPAGPNAVIVPTEDGSDHPAWRFVI